MAGFGLGGGFILPILPEFFHFRGYLRDPGMARFEEHLQAPDIRLAVARMIASVAR